MTSIIEFYEIKSMKLHPIVKEWRLYHKYSLIKSKKLSLFFIKKRTFKIFKQEAKQDSYSIKNLLMKAFPSLNNEDYFFYSKQNLHKSFWSDHIIYNKNTGKFVEKNPQKHYFCIHCGISTYLS